MVADERNTFRSGIRSIGAVATSKHRSVARILAGSRATTSRVHHGAHGQRIVAHVSEEDEEKRRQNGFMCECAFCFQF